MEIKDYLGIIKRRFTMFVLVIALICIANGVYSEYYLSPTYSATSQVKILRESYGKMVPFRSQFARADFQDLISWFNVKISILNDRVVTHAAKKLWTKKDPHFEAFQQSKLFTGMRKAAEDDFNRFKKEQDKAAGKLEMTKDQETFMETRFARFIRGNVKIVEVKDPSTNLPTQMVDLKAELSDRNAAISLVNALAMAAEEFHKERPKKQIAEAKKKLETRIENTETDINKIKTAIDTLNSETATKFEQNGLVSESTNFAADYPDRIRYLIDMKSFYGRKITSIYDQLQINQKMLDEISVKIDRDVADYKDKIDNGWVSTTRLSNYQTEIETLKQTKTDYLSGEKNFQPTHPKVRAVEEKILLLEEFLDEARNQEIENFRGIKNLEFRAKYKDVEYLDSSKKVYTFALKEITDELGIMKEFWGNYTEQVTLKDRAETIKIDYNTQLTEFINNTDIKGLLVVNGLASSRTVSMHAPLPLTPRGWGLCILIALVVAIFVVYFIEYIDTRISTEHDVRRYLNIPVIGVIPALAKGKLMLTDVMATSPTAEIFNTSATLIHSVISEKGYRSLAICSALPREGKTTMAVNLSIALARKGLNVILVDTDLRLPQVSNLFGLPNNVGLSTILEQKLEEKQIINDILEVEETVRFNLRDYLLQTSVPQLPNLRILPSGPTPQNPIHLIESGSMRGMIHRLKSEADVVIYDTPPVMKLADALSLSRTIDACLMVLAAGQIDHTEATWTKHLFNNVHADLIGLILNKSRHEPRSEYYKYYPYYRRKKQKVVRKSN